jgi:hypothetical protein
MIRRQWRVGWQNMQHPKESPSYFEDGIFDSFNEAEEFRKSIEGGIFHMLNLRSFVEVVPSKAVNDLNSVLGDME